MKGAAPVRIAAVIPPTTRPDTSAPVVEGLKAFGLQRMLVVDDASDGWHRGAGPAGGAEVLRLEPGPGGGKGQVMRAGIERIRNDDFDYYLFLDGGWAA